ncbi:MAG: thioesterase family protein, partial [Nocardioidaceae bacterium]|nr:thioesterase family protein [Nocardioidaceae bacterium]
MRHRYDCPLRWADLDLLGHINNVRYVDYLQEARAALLRECLHGAGVERVEGTGYVVVRHEISFVAPLMFGSRPVAIESWVSEIRPATFTLDHEIFHDGPEGERIVYLRARTVLAAFATDTGTPRRLGEEERTALTPYAEFGPRALPVRTNVPRESAVHYPVQVRFSDIDIYRHVNNVTYVEYFQEARIALFRKAREAVRGLPKVGVVVAQTDIEYLAPMTRRAPTYDCWAAVTRLGAKSMMIESELVDDAAETGQTFACAQVVVVFFDPATQRSVAPPAGYREAI